MPIATEATVALIRAAVELVRDAVQGVLNTRPASVQVNGTITALNGTVDGTTDVSGYGSVRLAVTGTFVGTIAFQSSLDGATWVATTLVFINNNGSGTSLSSTNLIAVGDLPGKYFRVIATAFTSGTATVSLLYSAASRAIPPSSVALPAGTNYIGKVRPDGVVVTGSLAALNATVDGTTDLSNFAGVRVQLSGTWVGTVTFQSSVDGTNWTSRQLSAAAGGTNTTTSTGNNTFYGDAGGRYFRLLMSAWTSGTVAASVLYTAATPAPYGFLRAAAAQDGAVAGSIDEVALGAYNGATIDRLATVGGISGGVVSSNNVLAVAQGLGASPSLNAATVPAAGALYDGRVCRPNHTLQVDVTTTTAGTAGTHTVQLRGSLDGSNWTTLGTVTPASTSTTGTDASNHGSVTVGGQAWRYLHANWTAVPTSWVGTLTARVASA